MKIERANDQSKPMKIDYYKQKSIEELKLIKPKWAYGKYDDRVLDSSICKLNSEYSIFMVDTSELVRVSEFVEVNTKILFTGEVLNDGRISRILFRWENNNFVDPPTIGLSTQFKDRLSFSDGRHRTKLAYHLGANQMPVAIHNLDISEVGRIIYILAVQD